MPYYNLFKLDSRNQPVHIGGQQASTAQKAIKQFTMGRSTQNLRKAGTIRIFAIPNIRQFLYQETRTAKGQTTYKKAFGRR